MLLFATSLSFGFPSFEQVKAQDRPSDLIFLSRDGAKIGSIRTEKHYRKLSWVGLAQIAPLARDILIATEDQRFFDHAGLVFTWYKCSKKYGGTQNPWCEHAYDAACIAY